MYYSNNSFAKDNSNIKIFNELFLCTHTTETYNQQFNIYVAHNINNIHMFIRNTEIFEKYNDMWYYTNTKFFKINDIIKHHNYVKIIIEWNSSNIKIGSIVSIRYTYFYDGDFKIIDIINDGFIIDAKYYWNFGLLSQLNSVAIVYLSPIIESYNIISASDVELISSVIEYPLYNYMHYETIKGINTSGVIYKTYSLSPYSNIKKN